LDWITLTNFGCINDALGDYFVNDGRLPLVVKLAAMARLVPAKPRTASLRNGVTLPGRYGQAAQGAFSVDLRVVVWRPRGKSLPSPIGCAFETLKMLATVKNIQMITWDAVELF
jgi:hypothetical protein